MVADQLSKAWAVSALADRDIVIIPDFLELSLTFNPGAAFSSFQGIGPLIGILGLAVAGWIIVMMRKAPRTIEALALAVVLGGAAGNLIDRIFRGDGLLDGSVVDFIDWWFIPTFNVADSAITVGAVLLVIAAITAPGGSAARAEPGGTDTSDTSAGERDVDLP